jgi:iron only hydrogenase large subunit-like protein
MSGTLLKSVLSRALGLHPSQIWHLAVMPCFDKKLEASREELTDRWWNTLGSDSTNSPVRDVDCVITPRELLSLADARGVQLGQLPLRPLSASEAVPFPDSTLSRFLFPKPRRRQQQQQQQHDMAGSSGGYLYHVMASAQAQNPGSTISVQRGRNSDVLEYALVSPSGQTLMKCARYYGFRNIQNLVRKLKAPKQSKLPGAAARRSAANGGSDYVYVEVMACPGGCTNGGGQIKVEDVAEILPQTRGEEIVDAASPQSQKEWLRRVDEAYYSADSDAELEEQQQDEDVVMTNGNGHYDDDNHVDGRGVSAKHLVNGIDVSEVRAFLHHWAGVVGVPLDKLAYTTFRQVESDVGKNSGSKKTLNDTERIAQIAGMSGGGW